MGILDAITKEVIGGALPKTLIEEVLTSEHPGGLQAIVDKLHQNGMGSALASWTGSGQYAPLTNDAIHLVLGSQLIQNISAKTGIPMDQLVAHFAENLPTILGTATANGQITVPVKAA